MDRQTLATATLLVPAIVLGVVGWRARRAGRTQFGLGLRQHAVGDFIRGMLFSLPFLAMLLLVFGLTGASRMTLADGDTVQVLGIWAYFLILFLVEEVVSAPCS